MIFFLSVTSQKSHRVTSHINHNLHEKLINLLVQHPPLAANGSGTVSRNLCLKMFNLVDSNP